MGYIYRLIIITYDTVIVVKELGILIYVRCVYAMTSQNSDVDLK